MKPRWILSLAAGLLFVTGVACRVWVGQLSEAHDKIERLPFVNAPDFRKAKPGAEVLVAGTLSDRNPELADGFVCMISYRRNDDPKGPAWIEESRRTPPLWLTARDGEVHLINANYRIEAPLAGRKLEVEERGLRHVQADPARATTGFARGDRVVAFGKVSTSEGVGELTATWVFGGTRPDWLDDAARETRVPRLVPWTLWALALVFAALAFVRRR